MDRLVPLVLSIVPLTVLVSACDSSELTNSAEFLDGTTWETTFNLTDNQTIYRFSILVTLEVTGTEVAGEGTGKGTVYLEAGSIPLDFSLQLQGSVVDDAVTFEMVLSAGDPPPRFHFVGEISADRQRMVGIMTPGELTQTEVVFVRQCGCG